ncbi:hypothetical protein ASE09_26605 [Streptomyces sp. Root66D1]|nr:hypothetical protein ASD33_29795 [Streptomyces sp. Root1304]KRA97062.1 hypothetical protein ASE09_26605 [Streptomyces sp. Root66D1]
MENLRIEGFSGRDTRLYGLISEGRVKEYRQAAYEIRSALPSAEEASKWNGPISFHEDGTVKTLSILPVRSRSLL